MFRHRWGEKKGGGCQKRTTFEVFGTINSKKKATKIEVEVLMILTRQVIQEISKKHVINHNSIFFMR